ncbi:hypothetical protein [Caudoviricetes sp.]|nr:hypothetical protein [Caudoviricetes sp.]
MKCWVVGPRSAASRARFWPGCCVRCIIRAIAG